MRTPSTRCALGVGLTLASGASPAMAAALQRLADDKAFETGTEVRYANGGRQVSYNKVPALIAAPAGDVVRLCLTSVPKNCPPGDDRGRIDRTTLLRTRQHWTLPDSQHACEGA